MLSKNKVKEKSRKEVDLGLNENISLPAPKKNSFFSPELFLFFLAFVFYFGTVFNDYALDDIAVIQQNKFTQQGFAGIPNMLTTFYWQGYWDQNAGLYRPLSLITFAIEYQFFKLNPHVSHFFNVLLFALSTFLLFRLLRKLFHNYSVLLSFLATLLFLIHPIHTEVIANIKSRDELLCLLFFILSITHLYDYASSFNKRNFYFGLLYFILALFSKEGAVTFLILIPLTLWFFTNITKQNLIKLSTILGVITLVFIAIHYLVIHNGPPTREYTYWDNSLFYTNSKLLRFSTAVFMLGKYLVLLIWPHPLSYDYSFNQIPLVSVSSILFLFSFVVHLGLLRYAFFKLRRKSLLSYALLFYFISIALVANVFFQIGATMAERLLYIPSIGFCLAVAYLVTKWLKLEKEQGEKEIIEVFKSNMFFTAAVFSLCFLAGYKVIARNKEWKDNFTLFKADVKSAPNSSRTNYNYGTELLNKFALVTTDTAQKRVLLNEVVTFLELSAKIDSASPGTYLNLSSAYFQLKWYDKIIAIEKQIIESNQKEGRAYYMVGNSYFRTKQFKKAIELLEVAANKGFEPNETYNTIGACYFSLQDFQNAIISFKKAIEIKPDDLNALSNLGGAYGSVKDFDNALLTFKKSLSIDSLNPNTWYYLALTYSNKGDKQNAEYAMNRMNQLKH